ncbi:ferredoxin [Nocardia sp. NPDC050378]|uniref:ferredoxin n=1 Tax=Nocardia sp. NPDC050378 TaxID=3155400 RepID=UPI0033D20AD0
MRVITEDWDCAASGSCSAVDAELFPADSDGYIDIGDGVQVPPGKEELAHAAVAACPMGLLRIEQ